MRNDEFSDYLLILLEFLRKDVLRYKEISDQKSRLIARLMLQKTLENIGRIDLIYNWKRDHTNKPFIDGWDSFNIAHSADMVVFGHTSSDIGIDIEKIIEVNYNELLSFFHPIEQEYIVESKDRKKSFYEIWVKKEAALKAIGTGMVNGLKEFSCVNENFNMHGNTWYFQSLQIHPDYTSYMCSLNKASEITLNEFVLENLIN